MRWSNYCVFRNITVDGDDVRSHYNCMLEHNYLWSFWFSLLNPNIPFNHHQTEHSLWTKWNCYLIENCKRTVPGPMLHIYNIRTHINKIGFGRATFIASKCRWWTLAQSTIHLIFAQHVVYAICNIQYPQQKSTGDFQN